MLPSEYLALSERERAFIIASINYRNEQEEKARKEAERKARRK